MMSIQRRGARSDYDDYTVEEIAARYGVTRDAVYRGIRKRSPLYPLAVKQGNGTKAWLVITGEAVESCDARRIAFYKTTPSWLKLEGLDWVKPPKRMAANVMLGVAV